MHLKKIGVSNEDCAIKARKIQIHSGVFFSRDCEVEASYQVARNQCMDLQISSD